MDIPGLKRLTVEIQKDDVAVDIRVLVDVAEDDEAVYISAIEIVEDLPMTIGAYILNKRTGKDGIHIGGAVVKIISQEDAVIEQFLNRVVELLNCNDSCFMEIIEDTLN